MTLARPFAFTFPSFRFEIDQRSRVAPAESAVCSLRYDIRRGLSSCSYSVSFLLFSFFFTLGTCNPRTISHARDARVT